MSSIISTVALLGSLAATVRAHGYVSGIVADGTYHQGYDISFSYQQNPPVVVGWSEMNQDNGYVNDYTSPDIICHKQAKPAGTHAEINGGDKLEFQWNTWPESHKGPVLTYLAKCDGKCEDADKTTLNWFKIAEGGLLNDDSYPGKWVTDDLIANNNSYTVTIPDSIASGNYVARHEIIALHSAGQVGGAQNYPYCVNLAITSSGSDQPDGVLGTALYKATDPGIEVNIYAALDYKIPGPPLYKGASSGSAAASSPAASSAAPSSSAAAAPSSTAAASPVTTQAAVATSSAAPSYVATSEITDIVHATTAVTVTGSAPAATGTATGSSPGSSGSSGSVPKPSKEIPEGTTLEDLLGWIDELFDAKKTSGNSKAKRAHPRHIRM